MTVQFVRGATAAEWSQKMTELKPCPCCGSERTQHSDDVAFLDCLECGVVFKCPAPALPEGYRVEEYKGFTALEFCNVVEGWEYSWDEVARIDERIGLTTHRRAADLGAPEHWPAVIAFLQGAR